MVREREGGKWLVAVLGVCFRVPWDLDLDLDLVWEPGATSGIGGGDRGRGRESRSPSIWNLFFDLLGGCFSWLALSELARIEGKVGRQAGGQAWMEAGSSRLEAGTARHSHARHTTLNESSRKERGSRGGSDRHQGFFWRQKCVNRGGRPS